MTVVLDAPGVTPPSAPPRPASPRPGLLAPALTLGAVLLLTLAALGAVRSAGRFEPISPTFTGSAPELTLPSYGPRGTYVVGYVHHATTHISLPLTNRGRLPLTVHSVDLGGGLAPLLRVQGVAGLPLSLRPGQTGTVEVTAELANCRFFHEREIQYYTGVQLDVSVLGQGSTRWAPLDRPILVHSPMIVGCPERKLNRQADNRRDLLNAV